MNKFDFKSIVYIRLLWSYRAQICEKITLDIILFLITGLKSIDLTCTRYHINPIHTRDF